jgi:hypothetical protein
MQDAGGIDMGRTIPSVSQRIDAKIAQWERFAKHLPRNEQEAFRKLVVAVRDRRGAIDAADEADIGVAMLLAMLIGMRGHEGDRRKDDAEASD